MHLPKFTYRAKLWALLKHIKAMEYKQLTGIRRWLLYVRWVGVEKKKGEGSLLYFILHLTYVCNVSLIIFILLSHLFIDPSSSPLVTPWLLPIWFQIKRGNVIRAKIPWRLAFQTFIKSNVQFQLQTDSITLYIFHYCYNVYIWPFVYLDMAFCIPWYSLRVQRSRSQR